MNPNWYGNENLPLQRYDAGSITPNWYGGEHLPVQCYNAANINIVYNTYNAGNGISPARSPEPEPDSEDEQEFVPQYSVLPSLQPFLSAQRLSRRYTEIQIGLAYYPAFKPETPACDNCRSRRRSGKRPIVYTCFECIPFKARELCRKCAEQELADDEALHRPNHKVRQWQPVWTWNFKKGFRTPLLSQEMEDFVRDDLDDDLRAAVFESSRYYDDRAVRVVVPAPPGLCRVYIKFEIESYESVKRERDVVDKLKGLWSSEGNEVFGNVGASAYPSPLQLPLRPRDPHSEPQEPPKKGELNLSDSVDLKRKDDFSQARNLEVYATANEGGAIEVVLQDEYYRSQKYRSIPFTWKLVSISIAHVPPLAPSFASLAQMEMYRRKRMMEIKQQSQNQMQNFSEGWQQADEAGAERTGRERERADVPASKEQRPSSMPPRSNIDGTIPALIATAVGGVGRVISNRQGRTSAPTRDARGRALLSPLDAIQGTRSGYPGRSVSPNWRANNPVPQSGQSRGGTSSGRFGGVSPSRLRVPSPGVSPGRPVTAMGGRSSMRRPPPSPRPVSKPLRFR